jgi:hypothetical protein
MEDEELKFGPNGGLIFCMEYLMENMDWLQRQLSGGVGDDDQVCAFMLSNEQNMFTCQPPSQKKAVAGETLWLSGKVVKKRK